MWWARSNLVECYFGSTIVGLRCGRSQAVWQPVADVESGLKAVGAFLAAHRGGRQRSVRVWLGAAHAKPFSVQAASGAKNRMEAMAIATAMSADFADIRGDASIWLDTWREDAACSAVAADALLLGAMQGACSEVGWKCVSVRPWWCLPLAHAEALSRRSGEAMFWSVSEPDGLTMGNVVAGKVESIDWMAVLEHDPSWIHAIRRATIGAGAGARRWHAAAVLTEVGDVSQAVAARLEPVAIGAWAKLTLK